MSRLLLAALLLSTAGCATLINGPTDRVVVQSNVPGARVEASNGSVGTTPFELVLQRPDRVSLEVSAPGYEKGTALLTPSFDPITLASCLFWPGLIVDVLSGAAFMHPPYVFVRLQPGAPAPPSTESGPRSVWQPAPAKRRWRTPRPLDPGRAVPAPAPSPPLVRAPGGEADRGDEPQPLE